MQATVLPGPHVLAGSPDLVPDVGPVGTYLYDPDPAVTRSGLVGTLARQLGARGVDHGIAFLTADVLAPSPFASAYRVAEVIPFSPKRVGVWLREHGVGRVTVVKRGSDVDADELVRKWKLRGDGHRQMILTRVAGRPAAVIAERIGP